MADITMCVCDKCPMRENCYRIQAEPDELQSWSNFEYTCNENNGFAYYIKNE